MHTEYLESLSPKNLAVSPRLNRHFEKVKQFIKRSNEINDEIATIHTDETQIDPKHIEFWIGSALRESLKEGYASEPKYDPKMSILKTFGIDRNTLLDLGIKVDSINRLYRILYVYSVGFYEIMKEPLEGTKNKPTTISAIWKVYSILLQYV